MQQYMSNKDDLESKVKRLQDMFPSIPAHTIRLQLHSCGSNFEQCSQKLLEAQRSPDTFKRPSDNNGNLNMPSKSIMMGNSQKLSLPQLHSEMQKVSEKSLTLLEQKISHQEADISLLKDMIKARDLTIEKLQKELQDLRNVREREKSSASVVNDLASSIKANVDSGFRTVQDSNGVDYNKLVIEVKKQLAMSFLNDFKESRVDRSTTGKFTMSTLMGPGVTASPLVNMESIPSAPMDVSANNNADHIPPPPPPQDKAFDTTNLVLPLNNIPYFPPYYQNSNSQPPTPKFGYGQVPYYGFTHQPHNQVQPSAPAFFPHGDPQKPT
jgi:uncharacterized coiled-coil protein SlyX